MTSALVAVMILGQVAAPAPQVNAIRAGTLHTMAGPSLTDAVVLIEAGKIRQVGVAAAVRIPAGAKIVEAEVVTPGLIDARATVGLTGIFNSAGHDQDMIERSTAMQPELRAIDAYNPLEELVAYLRSFGVTTVHTGHAPGALISGQTFVAKTVGNTADEAAIVQASMVSATLGPGSISGNAPGTRAKQMAVLRTELLRARAATGGAPNLRQDALRQVLDGELPLLVHAERAQDIVSALRLAKEFGFRLVLDGATEAYLVLDEIREAGVPVIVHPTMKRARGESENLSWENAWLLRRAGIAIALQSGYEGYVPKVRVVLFEAALAAANGLTFEEALGAITIDAARILGIDGRVGSISTGKDADFALFNGDPFEYTTQCVGTVVDGRLVSMGERRVFGG
jgi:imidazolonepropionase-like amidohydrolase